MFQITLHLPFPQFVSQLECAAVQSSAYIDSLHLTCFYFVLRKGSKEARAEEGTFAKDNRFKIVEVNSGRLCIRGNLVFFFVFHSVIMHVVHMD